MHCSNCGATDPVVRDSYTACCNDTECAGWGEETWAYGMSNSRELVGEVTGCCFALARQQAPTRFDWWLLVERPPPPPPTPFRF